jgi:hypothetical protein
MDLCLGETVAASRRLVTRETAKNTVGLEIGHDGPSALLRPARVYCRAAFLPLIVNPGASAAPRSFL